jgi:serine/threonine protein kinase
MLPIGTILRNRYEIIRHLGSGGFGATYLAEDLNRPLAEIFYGMLEGLPAPILREYAIRTN